ncbi:hypothetical protein A2316_00645 [Candidatus Falkowbacteria bacterium RIFOXYB2_FULL_38_15]|uniref:O-antigen ligase-related domain-containing protein n=1 Tax=Candidatus Falkowbacteria bacterium RIFOXYA2_FULL_38_12 TaxID=1797993 RepID=A0A1F5S3M9_9BACT|nr:MAG: hypothetical protein A2257_00140 [Candidatus Falkowbacteria bacterium RIFOXYA2_FULL_38_12]OGF32711.1 MAG: hypothetical protein A2316_00645 [Candidatus Falkowbacteria bacterium RIFOXYB2_FULL_38_15]OGF42253.1 MAG: hypothetical protein A2555_03250 [Candidatus Falkowbacteria bacterium RIFOXYD2_FULL_39_16]
MFSKLYKILFPDEAPERQKVLLTRSFVLVLLIAIVAVFAPWKITIGVLAVILVFLLFFRFINLGFYLIVFLYPFIYLQLFIGRDINIPYVDVIAMFVFAAWGLRSLLLPPHGGLLLLKSWGKGAKLSLENFPGLLFFLLFFLASILSLINTESFFFSLKYIFRPLTFFYLMFVVLPYNIINSKKILFRVFWILFGVGIFVSLMGLWSIIFSTSEGLFRRAIPVEIFGIPILGTNHNLISEVLISVIPICFILIWETNKLWLKKFLIVGLLFMIAINLLTLSRTGWIALTLELAILVFVKYRKNVKSFAKLGLIIFLIVSPLVVYGYIFMTSELVRDSNTNRWALTIIALENFYDHPVIGNGAGTFIEQVSEEKWYIVNYGSPSEAHGVVQKLLAETGLIGFLTFFALLGYILLRLVKIYRQMPEEEQFKNIILALILTSLGSIVFQLFQTSYFVSKFWLPLGIALAAAGLAEEEVREKKRSNYVKG